MKMLARLLLIIWLSVGVVLPAEAMRQANDFLVETALDGTMLKHPGHTARVGHLLKTGLVKACSDEGLGSFYRGNFALAVDSFNLCVAKGLVSDRVYYFRGRTYMEMNRNDEALQDLTQAIELNPRSTESLSRRALLYYRMSEPVRAHRDVAAVLDLGNDARAMAMVLRVQSKLYQDEGKDELARISSEQAAKIDPTMGWFRSWNNYMNPQQMSRVGMMALLVLPAFLIFRLTLPAPKKRP